MNSFQIEAWALRVIDAVNAGQPNEDFRVELKREWIDAKKAARILAGHANSARGENILWLIGVDEVEGVIGVSANDLAGWAGQLEACFSELAPRLTPLNIPIEGKTIVAILFETARAPFVVKAPDGGAIQFEVPWRDGTRTRSAKRADLMRLLAPLEQLPEVEILNVRTYATVEQNRTTIGGGYIVEQLRAILILYIIPKVNVQVVIPFHRCHGWFEIPEIIPQTEFSKIEMYPAQNFSGMGFIPSATVRLANNEVIFTGPGAVELQAVTDRPNLPKGYKGDIHASIRLTPAHNDRPIVLTTTFPYPPEE